jgi:hypothetical protein
VRAPLPLPAAASISMQGCYSVGRMGEIADRRLLEDDGCDVRTAATVRVGVILVLTYQNQGFLIGQEFGRGMENYYPTECGYYYYVSKNGRVAVQ